jgi:hypothetical protein
MLNSKEELLQEARRLGYKPEMPLTSAEGSGFGTSTTPIDPPKPQ